MRRTFRDLGRCLRHAPQNGTRGSRAVAAMAEFKRCGFAEVITGSNTRLRVAVQAPATEHEISVGKVRDWLQSSDKSPAQRVLKGRLRELLGE